jgi:hypothetical protein
MIKTIVRLLSGLSLICLVGIVSLTGAIQEKARNGLLSDQDAQSASIKRIQENTFMGIQSEGGPENQNTIDEDFIREPKKLIEFRIEHLLIKPSDTVPLEGAFNLKTESGKTVSYSYLARLKENEKENRIDVFITPRIIANKGIELTIKVLFEKKTLKEEKVTTGNYESVVLELLENKEQKIRLADRIIPLILTIEPAKMYPKVLTELKFWDYRVLMNNEIMYRTFFMDLTVPGGSEKKPIFFAFYIRGKGIYVLSFSPFKGAEPIGVSKDNVAKFKDGKDYFEFMSFRPILPEGKWLVWVRHNPTYLPENDIPKDSLENPSRNAKVFTWFDSTGELIERVFGNNK